MKRSERSGFILNRKFSQFLLPTIFSNIAISLNEFVDGILVSQLLGAEAMALVNVASPVMFLFAFIYMFLGVGGSIVYSEFSGKQDTKQARIAYSVSILTSLFISALIVIFGLVFLGPLSKALCTEASALGEFTDYLRFLLISGILIIPIQIIIINMAALGCPRIGTIINIIANVVNLFMDYVYIHFLNMGLKGAALATFTGYLAGAIYLLIMVLMGRIKLPLALQKVKEFKRVPSIMVRGSASATNQIGYCIKIAFCNWYAARLAGMMGVTIFSLCMQVVSIASILISGAIDAMIPIAASLYGQRDHNGLQLLMKRVLKVQFAMNILILALFEAFPNIMIKIYNVSPDYSAAAILGLRIFSVMFVFRGFTLVFMSYFQVISRKLYSVAISLFDGVVGIITFCLVFGGIFGLNGIWIAFPFNSLVLLCGILLVNRMIVARSNGRYTGNLLIEAEPDDVFIYDITIRMNEPGAFDSVQEVQTFCQEHGMDEKRAVLISLSVEEMISYIMDNSPLRKDDHADILLRIHGNEALIYFRSIGQPFEPTSAPEGTFSNLDVLRKVAKDVDFSYVMGLNQTRVILN